MALEDFLLYTELDPNNHITINSAISVTHEAYRNETASLLMDKGIDYFDTEFTHYLETTPITWTDVGASLPIAYPWMLCNDTIASNPTISLRWLETSNLPKLELIEYRDGGSVSDQSIALSWGTKYYITIVRDATTLKCYIYSNTLRSVLVDTLTINLVLTSQKYRYIYVCYSYNIGSAYMFEYKIEKLFLGVGSGYSGSFISLDSGGSFDFRPIFWKETQKCDVAIRPVPNRSGPKVDTDHWMLSTRELTIRLRLSDASKTTLQTIFDNKERITIRMGTGWSYSGWLRGKPTKYEYRVVDGVLQPWLYELKLDIEVMNYNP